MTLWSTQLGKIVLTFLISMVPVVELRGAIPVGVAHGLDLWTAVAVSVAGNLLPVPFVILFSRRLFAWLRRKIPKLGGAISRLEQRAKRKSKMVRQFSFFGLVLLVAIPLPGTGAWTGALVAAILNMRLKRAFPAIALGVAIAAILVGAASHGVGALIA